ncbi:helix-turn-helix domain-containing protein [Williamsia limnetica]
MAERLHREVVELYGSGMTSRAVAEQTGLGRTTVLLEREGVAVRPRSARY